MLLRVLDLFSGIGGFSLGLESTGGFETVAFCEIEEFPRRVLAKHWPRVPCFSDVRVLDVDTLKLLGIWPIDVVCGGFPCQDISLAGKGAGLGGARSGLWWEMQRLLREISEECDKEGIPRPLLLAENVSALRSRGLDEVLGSLAAIGFDAQWHCIPASAVGAHHRRDRIWIFAYSEQQQLREQSGRSGGKSGASASFTAEHGASRIVADANGSGQPKHSERNSGSQAGIEGPFGCDAGGCHADVAHPARDVLAEQTQSRPERERVGPSGAGSGAGEMAYAYLEGLEGWFRGILQERSGELSTGESCAPRFFKSNWLVEPNVGRVVDGLSSFMDTINGIPIESTQTNPAKSSAGRVHRLRALGNAVVPQIPQIIGYAILEFVRRTRCWDHVQKP